MASKPKISETEKALFRDTVKKVKPLIHKKINASPPLLKKQPPPDIETQLSDQDELPPVSGSDYVQFARSGLQYKMFRQLKSGEYTINAVLDLHGKTMAEAKEALEPFLHDCQEHHLKCVLIIHGKGRHSETPLLKNRLNHWLRQIDTVLAFCSAKMKHGHTGALYVLLKTRKD